MPQSAAKSSSEERQSLNAGDWAAAALDAIVSGGLEAVAVEPLARQLGVTKGSFYWHFANREALVEAALLLWEREETDDIMERIGEAEDAYDRIVRVFKAANASYRSGRLYLALAAASDHPSVGRVVRRVSERRLSFLFSCYQALGLRDDEARRWSTFAYATFMGNLQIRRDMPEAIPQGQGFNDYLRLMIRTLVPRVREARSSEPTEEGDIHPTTASLDGAAPTSAGVVSS